MFDPFTAAADKLLEGRMSDKVISVEDIAKELRKDKLPMLAEFIEHQQRELSEAIRRGDTLLMCSKAAVRERDEAKAEIEALRKELADMKLHCAGECLPDLICFKVDSAG